MSAAVKGKVRRGFSLFGLLLVVLGAVLLLNTTGILPFGIWVELVDFWPVLLVLIGVKIILAPRAPLVCAGVVAMTLVGTVGAAFFSMPEYGSDEPLRVTYVEPLGNAEILRLGMGFAGGRVELRSYNHGVPSYPALFTADFNNRPARVIRDESGRVADIYLSTEVVTVGFTNDDGYAREGSGQNSSSVENHLTLGSLVDWSLTVSPEVDLELEINAGAADLDLDLRDLNVRRVVVGAGASDIRIQLPAAAGKTHVEIAAGATDIEISVPSGVAARISDETFLSSTHIDSDRFLDTEGGHMSSDYGTAANSVDIEISAFAANVNVS